MYSQLAATGNSLDKRKLENKNSSRINFARGNLETFQTNSSKLACTHFQKNWGCFKIINANQEARL